MKTHRPLFDIFIIKKAFCALLLGDLPWECILKLFLFFLNSEDFYTPVSVLLRFRRGGKREEVGKENQHSLTLISFRKEFASRRFLEM